MKDMKDIFVGLRNENWKEKNQIQSKLILLFFLFWKKMKEGRKEMGTTFLSTIRMQFSIGQIYALFCWRFQCIPQEYKIL